MSKPIRIAITPGEPAGIGPDLTIKIAQQKHACELIAVADPELLTQRANTLSLNLSLEIFNPSTEPTTNQPGHIKVLPVSLNKSCHCGELEPANAHYVLETLKQATHHCQDGTFQALVTGPVHKGNINKAGITFSGHTEFLAKLTNTPQVVMMLMTPGLKVALATTHLPLRQVSDAITKELLEDVICILNKDLINKFGLSKPNILVCGLNPHAGEDGYLGHEDKEIIAPTLEKLRQSGIQLNGPLPADTLFIPKYLDHADAVLAMYHDQGLPVLKHLGFGQAVNVTLGLPIIRTSVDHGTALELAGSSKASTGSLEMAIKTAIEMAQPGKVS